MANETPNPARPVLLAWSGGKDCLMALDRLAADLRWQVVALLSTLSADDDRIVMHGMRADIIREQARLLGLPLIEVAIANGADNDAYEAAHAAALKQAATRWPGLGHIAFGDLFLEDVRAWRERQFAKLGWTAVFPLWGEPTRELAAQFMQRGHRAVVCCVDTQQLDAGFCGREFDASFLDDLPASVDACGENGEFHTLAHGGPLFAQSIALKRAESRLENERFQYSEFHLAGTDSA